jgi:hypothetical protein
MKLKKRLESTHNHIPHNETNKLPYLTFQIFNFSKMYFNAVPFIEVAFESYTSRHETYLLIKFLSCPVSRYYCRITTGAKRSYNGAMHCEYVAHFHQSRNFSYISCPSSVTWTCVQLVHNWGCPASIYIVQQYLPLACCRCLSSTKV